MRLENSFRQAGLKLVFAPIKVAAKVQDLPVDIRLFLSILCIYEAKIWLQIVFRN